MDLKMGFQPMKRKMLNVLDTIVNVLCFPRFVFIFCSHYHSHVYKFKGLVAFYNSFYISFLELFWKKMLDTILILSGNFGNNAYILQVFEKYIIKFWENFFKINMDKKVIITQISFLFFFWYYSLTHALKSSNIKYNFPFSFYKVDL